MRFSRNEIRFYFRRAKPNVPLPNGRKIWIFHDMLLWKNRMFC